MNYCPWYHFWNPMSGGPGGCIMGVLLILAWAVLK